MTRPSSRKLSDRSAGFTLLEMLVALAILVLATVAATSLLRIRGGAADLPATALEIVSELRLAKSRAVTRNIETVLSIDTRSGSTWIDQASQTARSATGIAIELEVAAPERQSAELGGFRFFPSGGSTGGTIVLKRAGETITIAVDWLTGIADIRPEVIAGGVP